MLPAKKHRITATLFDLCVFGSLVQAAGAFLFTVAQHHSREYIGPTLLLYLPILIVYHAALANRVQFCTPGETMAGCRVTNNGKAWFTIFAKSRWFLFLNLFFLLYYPANAFDAMQRANEYPAPMVLGRSAFVCLFLWVIYRIAMGRFGWAIIIYIIMSIHFLAGLTQLEKSPEYAYVLLGMSVFQVIFLTITLVVYDKRLDEWMDEEKDSPTTDEETNSALEGFAHLAEDNNEAKPD